MVTLRRPAYGYSRDKCPTNAYRNSKIPLGTTTFAAGILRLWLVNHPFQFQKRSQYFIRAHNQTLSVVTVSVRQARAFAHERPLLRVSPNSNRLLQNRP